MRGGCNVNVERAAAPHPDPSRKRGREKKDLTINAPILVSQIIFPRFRKTGNRSGYPSRGLSAKTSDTFNRIAFRPRTSSPTRAPTMIRGSTARSMGPTLRSREYLWTSRPGRRRGDGHGQRGMGLDWPTSLELIKRPSKPAKPGNPATAPACWRQGAAPTTRSGAGALRRRR